MLKSLCTPLTKKKREKELDFVVRRACEEKIFGEVMESAN